MVTIQDIYDQMGEEMKGHKCPMTPTCIRVNPSDYHDLMKEAAEVGVMLNMMEPRLFGIPIFARPVKDMKPEISWEIWS